MRGALIVGAYLVQPGRGAVHCLQDCTPGAEPHGASLVGCAPLRHENDGRKGRGRVELCAVGPLLP